MTTADDALDETVRALVLAAGFARVGVARAERPHREAERLAEFLDRGEHGTMAWMERTRDVRSDPGHEDMLPGACSVLVAAAACGESEPVELGPGRVARYASGRDYHRVLDKKLKAAQKALRQAGYRARIAVDSKPVLERAFAQRAGVGFIGKNACLIVPGLGSHVLLACIVTDAPLRPDEPVREGCGECRACLDACPTSAFTAPRALDARRCISYLTIEHRGELSPEVERELGDWFFGCDACQDVCPYNAGRARGVGPMPELARDGRWDGVDAAYFLAATDADVSTRFEGSPLRRAGRETLARNAAIAMGNSGDRRHLPVLARAAHDESPVVRVTAARARARLEREET